MSGAVALPLAQFDAISGATTLAQLQSTLGAPGTEMTRYWGSNPTFYQIWRYSDGYIYTGWNNNKLSYKSLQRDNHNAVLSDAMASQINVGMTYAQVRAIVGSDPSSNSFNYNTTTGAVSNGYAYWYNQQANQNLAVTFDVNGLVSSKPTLYNHSSSGEKTFTIADLDAVYSAVTPGQTLAEVNSALAPFGVSLTATDTYVNFEAGSVGHMYISMYGGVLSYKGQSYYLNCNQPSATSYDLSVAVSGNGSVTGSGISCGTDCTETYATGTHVTLTATPASGYGFTGWSGACSGTQTCTVVMNAARSVSANFAPLVLPTALTLSGPTTLQTGARTNLTATARFSDNTERSVTPSWTSSNPAAAVVSAAGVLAAGAVSTDTSVTLTARYTDQGVSVEQTLQVTITAAPAALAGLTISGASSVQSGGQVRLGTMAQYADGSTRAVTPGSYTLSNAALGSVNAARATFSAASVSTDTLVTLTASFTQDGVTRTADLPITIRAAAAALARLVIIGAQSTLAAGQSLNLSTQGVYADGSRKTVVAGWQLRGSGATLSSTGVLTAQSASTEQNVVVVASYSEGAVSSTAEYQVAISAVPTPVVPVQVEVEASGTPTDFGLAFWSSVNADGTPVASAKTSATARARVQAAAGSKPVYNMYVAALVPGGALFAQDTILLLDRNREWKALGLPLAEYLAGVADNDFQLVELFDHLDTSIISGTRFYIGYGTSDAEMLSSGRIRLVYQLP